MRFHRGVSLLECMISTVIFSIVSMSVTSIIGVSSLQYMKSTNNFLAHQVAHNVLRHYASTRTVGADCGVAVGTGVISVPVQDNGVTATTNFTFNAYQCPLTGGPVLIDPNGLVEYRINVAWVEGGSNRSILLSGYSGP